MREFLAITKALSDETRVRALLALRGGELCLCHLIQLLELAPATLSKHMDVLVQAGLIERRKEGRWCYFRLAGNAAPGVVRRGLKWALDSLQDASRVQRDAERLARLRKADLTELSACYKS
ncbi:MAG TPA: metalloregulator ArsR/SmtB family transcription factor [Phycisphaerae bacterium]|nr:metalloregulator ArsR/SmtB family transcription factor [Phycisphaerae bacterium]HON66095.1 metalloregulator ArsR/SmtB family transcription factor [Phycisphaerae bacterium]HOQ87551.1 metalloregulator ArsR/SmtB family transcription factor [Phycisphaerae bacterium]HPP26094.1 metalloregulator ArsR/SmtB family transcription factor [Phycisphaerae bacterium]HPU26532.1 metalloregulator ArsR/SmtB family transcription factor [Phycisphaerae bacterium]